MTKIEYLTQALKQYDAAARKFIHKVEFRGTRSVETYADLKAALISSTRAQAK